MTVRARGPTEGWPDPFTRLHEQHDPRVRQRFLHLARDLDEADDLAAEFWWRVYRAWVSQDGFAGVTCLSAYLNVTATNVWKTHCRQRGRLRARARFVDSPDAVDKLICPLSDDAFKLHDFHDLICTALRNLPPIEQDVLLAVISHKSYRTIKSELSQKYSDMNWNLNRVVALVRALREYFLARCEPGGL